MVLAADYPFLSVMWSMLVFFAWVIWFWLLITVFADLFRRHDIGGGAKVLWMIFVIILPYLGVFIYLITQNQGMGERNLARAQEQQSQFDAYVQSGRGIRRLGGRDREGQGAARQRCHHAGRVRRAQAEGARLT